MARGSRSGSDRSGGRTGRRAVVIGLVALALLAVVAVGVTAWQALQAREALRSAQAQVQRLQEQLVAADIEGARATLDDLQGNTERARENTTGPVWAAAEHLPWLGDDVTAVRIAAAVTDDVAQAAMPPLVDAASGLNPAALAPVDGAVDLAPLQAARKPLSVALSELETVQARVEAIDTDGLIDSIAGPVGQLQSALSTASDTTRAAQQLATLAPPMLGADGPRTYLVMFQNNAEVRATGGLPGALAVVRAEQGRLSLVEQAPASRIGRFDEPVLPLEGRALTVNGERLGRFIGDVNFTPHFPTTAELVREMWRRDTGQEVDGVLSTDPVALSYLLRATGPVQLPGRDTITADNAVDLLLSDVYHRFPDGADQNDYFAAAAASVFAEVVSGVADASSLLPELRHSVAERRLLLWSAHEHEQEVIAQTPLAGTLPDGGPGEATIGVFFNDGTGAKMSYYLDSEVVVQPGCAAVGSAPVDVVTVRLTSTAPPDAASLPGLVNGESGPLVGRSGSGLEPGEFRTQVLVYAPLGGGVVSATQDGAQVPLLTEENLDRQVAVFTVDLTPRQEATLDVRVQTRSSLDPQVVMTPTVGSPDVTVPSRSCG